MLLTPLYVVLLFSVGCATLPYEPYARVVKVRTAQGGTIALHSEHRTEDRAKADTMMMTNCGTNASPQVMEEGEMVVGEKTDSSTQQSNNYHSNPAFKVGALTFGSTPSNTTTGSSFTTQLKEWHITYQCVANTSDDAAPVAKRTKKKK